MTELDMLQVAKLSLFLFGLSIGWWMLFRRAVAPLFSPERVRFQPWELEPDPREAHRWLVTERGDLARERFRGPHDALRFIDRLYAAGARGVLVCHICEEPRTGPEAPTFYADSVVVELPEDRESREGLFQLAADEARRGGLPPETDEGQAVLHIWWE
jgi:hypothetical protein